jgi:serine/threonine-protein kinase
MPPIEDGQTRTAPPGSTPAVSRPASGGRFVSGTVLADRYRIVSLLGRGGMGEVYKADDLKLDQPVALKFLPETLGLSAPALARFHAEVRIARQVSHPNVCRVYDIGEIDGLHFFTMEFIDGEDLASLLRRIGRLPSDKAVEIARQLCAGLAAAHDAGVLHRDLKPANVMIDGRGRARVTDFGVAAIAREIRSEHVLAGTPAYMAPEQLKGQESTIRSDVYALGLVLYEIFTGKRAVDAKTLAEAVMYHTSGATITTPSNWISDLDPVVERAILRCLERDPADRPASAIQVAAALPGGDPLYAALAAGETPSPEMVAAAGSRELLRPAVGLTVLAATVVVLLIGAWARTQTSVLGRVPFELPPDVLAHKARELLRQLGHRDPPADTALGFDNNTQYLNYVSRRIEPSARWSLLESGRPPAVLFWYRESPQPLEVVSQTRPGKAVSVDDPPLTEPGMTLVHLDSAGRLVGLRAVTKPASAAGRAAPTDWGLVFAAAGLDQRAFTPDEPHWTPGAAFDDRAAWTGAFPGHADLPIRIEAAAYQGQIVSFELLGPWRPAVAASAARVPFAPLIIIPLVTIGAAIVAWRNARAGRGDRRAAFRIAVLFLVMQEIDWLLLTHHLAGPREFWLFRQGLGFSLVNSLLGYVAYLAIEPYVRRHWPQVLIAWSRAFAGRLHDPLIGRELLVGVALGAIWFVLNAVQLTALTTPGTVSQLDNVSNLRQIAALILAAAGSSMLLSLVGCLLIVAFRVVLRKVWLAAAAFVALGAFAGSVTPAGLSIAGAISLGLVALMMAIALMRFGLIAMAAVLASFQLLSRTPTTLDMSAWYAGTAIFTLAVLIAAAAYGCYLAIGGRLGGLTTPSALPSPAQNRSQHAP